MNPTPDPLQQFLTTYAPTPPPPDPGLEDRMMAQLTPLRPQFPHRWVWGTSLVALCSGLTLLWQGQRPPNALTATDYAQLENSLIRSWEASTVRSEIVPSLYLFDDVEAGE